MIVSPGQGTPHCYLCLPFACSRLAQQHILKLSSVYQPTQIVCRRSRRVVPLRQQYPLLCIGSTPFSWESVKQSVPNLFLSLLSQVLRMYGFRQGGNNLLESGSLLLMPSFCWKTSLLMMLSFMPSSNNKSVTLSLRWQSKCMYKKHIICLPWGMSK